MILKKSQSHEHFKDIRQRESGRIANENEAQKSLRLKDKRQRDALMLTISHLIYRQC